MLSLLRSSLIFFCHPDLLWEDDEMPFVLPPCCLYFQIYTLVEKISFKGMLLFSFACRLTIMHLPITSLMWELETLEGGTNFILFLCLSCFYNTIICKPVFLYFILSLQFTAVEVATHFDSDWNICLLDFHKNISIPIFLSKNIKTLIIPWHVLLLTQVCVQFSWFMAQ